MPFARIQPVAARPDLSAITDEEAAALARATVNLFGVWQHSDAEARTWLGDMAQRAWARWKTGQFGRIDHDLRARMAILMGIHQAVRYLFAEPARGDAWIRTPSDTFDGRSARDIMMRGDITDPANWEALAFAEAKFDPRIRESIGDLSKVPVARRVAGPGASCGMAPYRPVFVAPAGSNDIAWPSLRYPGGHCIAVFWPDAIPIPIPEAHFADHWNGTAVDYIKALDTGQVMAVV